MKTLILTRHAKSSWDSPGHDHDRVLNARGREAAPKIGQWIRDQGLGPDAILCSSAARTQETCALLGFDIKPKFLRELYLAPAEDMLQALKGAEGNCAVMIGHNPGIADFAHRLINKAPEHPRFYDYPTCATTVMTFDIDNWSEMSFGVGNAVDFVIPKELP